jgi:glycosyltransferase involved in cell wall biosynthesis
MSKKIIMHLISNLNEGGAEISLYQLCLNTPEFEHIVVSMMDEGKFGPMLQREGVRLYCLYMPKGQLTFQSIIHFWRILRCDKPNILQTWMYHADFFGGIIGSIAGIENIIWGIRHGNLTAGTVNNKTFFLAKFCAFLSHFIPKKIVSCSKRAMEAHIAFGYERALITVIPNGCDSSFYSPNLLARMSLRKNWGIESNVFLFGMVARYDTQKDHANLLCALQILRKVEDSFHCILIGTNINYENEQLKGLLAKLGLKDVVATMSLQS